MKNEGKVQAFRVLVPILGFQFQAFETYREREREKAGLKNEGKVQVFRVLVPILGFQFQAFETQSIVLGFQQLAVLKNSDVVNSIVMFAQLLWAAGDLMFTFCVERNLWCTGAVWFSMRQKQCSVLSIISPLLISRDLPLIRIFFFSFKTSVGSGCTGF